MRVLVTGGAGFVGSNVAVALAERHPDWELVAFDNLRRRGSELNLPRLRETGVEFVHGDVRELSDLEAVQGIAALVECSAEPSVLAGLAGGLDYLARTNLMGAYNCLEVARSQDAHLVFLSTSRVYPVAALAALAFDETPTRLELADNQPLPGVGPAGISEEFPLGGACTPYGATKLAAELLIAEYAESFGLRAVIDRCGAIAGPWQMGKFDQGIVTANVGGGPTCSSLQEATELCQALTGRQLEVNTVGAGRPGDVPIYISDCSRLFGHTNWRPQRDPRAILVDTFAWAQQNESAIRSTLGFD